MILHDITLSGFRTFADKVRVGPFDSNITVIHAPNGTGKSTLLDGFYHGLLESHTVSGTKAETMMRSGGRDLVPTVSVEFETGGIRYRLEKRFLDRPEAKLSRFENGAFIALSEGDAATAFPRQLLMAKPSQRGAMKRDEHFGLGAILWASQGRIEVDGISGDALGAARSMLGGFAAVAGAADIAVAEMAEQWFAKFYTRPNRESTAVGSANLPGLRKQLSEAEKRFSSAQAAYSEVDRLRLRFEETAADKLRYAAMVTTLENELGTLAEVVKAFSAATLEKVKADANCAGAEGRFAVANAASKEIERLRAAKASADRKEAVQVLARDRAIAEEDAARERLACEQAGGAAVAAAVEAAEGKEAVARDAASFVAARHDAVAGKQRLGELEQLRSDINDARKARIELNAPSSAQIRKLRTVATEITTSRAHLDAAILHVAFSPTTARAVEIIAGKRASASGSSTEAFIEVSGSPIVEFSIAGVGTIRAHGPSASAESIREELANLETKFTKLAQAFGSKDLAELENRAERLVALDNKLENLESQLAGRTSDWGSIDDIQEGIAAGAALIARLALAYPAWVDSEPDAESLASAAKEALSTARGARAVAAAAIQIANAELETRAKARLEAEAAFSKASAQTLLTRTQLEVAERDGHDDASRAKALEELGLEVIGARRERDNADETIATFAEDPRETYAALERRRNAARLERENASELHAETRALLDAANASGPYETLALAETDVVELRAQLHRSESEARAATLLHNTFVAVEADREAAVLAPVRKRTAELYGRITASDAPELHFKEDLTFDSLEAGGVRYSQTLSGGEREQLHMLTRLALADLVTQGERQLIILDDSLTSTDPRRFARFLGLIEEFSRERMQFVIATCDKARYLGLDGAKFIDLETARRPIAESRPS